MSNEHRTIYKSGILAGFTPSHSVGGPRNWSEGQGLVNVEGFNYWQQPDFNARHPIRGRHVWYSFVMADRRKQAEENIENLINDSRTISSKAGFAAILKAGLANPQSLAGTASATASTIGQFGPGLTGGEAMAPFPKENPQVQLLKAIHNEFKLQSGAYTGTYLTEINNLLAETYGKDVKESPKRAGGRPLSIREQAHPSRWSSEEQTDILTDQSDAEKVGDIPPPIGATQPVDAYLKIGDRIVAIDVSEQLAVGKEAGAHHSLTGGPLYKNIEDVPKSRDKIREDMKDYYNKQISEKWNPAVRLIKAVAQQTYETDMVTAEQMRSPQGPGYGGGTVRRTGAGTWAPGGGQSMTIAQARGRSAGNTAAWAAARRASNFTDAKMTTAVTKHVMHSIGNWNATAGTMWDTYTLSHTPLHITAGAKLVQYKSGQKMFEWRRMVKERVAVFDGPATHGIIKHEGYAINKKSSLVLDDQMAGHLGMKALGGGTTQVLVGGNTVRNATSASRKGFSAGIFIPGKSLNAKMNRICRELVHARGEQRVDSIHKRMQGEAPYGPHFSYSKIKAPGRFNDHMLNFRTARAIQLGVPFRDIPRERSYTMWANPYYGIADVGEEQPDYFPAQYSRG